ncbi:hypothetical protein K502DRAFT_333766 [Neoconidiobolus thromboides FSU 785]|nr:hypothetical protein K502DRAFT_333766 [Neoconidiobolus thromboides FSU 785]
MEEKEIEKIVHYLNISIKYVDMNNKHFNYMMEVKTNLNQYKHKQLKDVSRSYQEFLKLYNYLTANYTDLLVPVLPPQIKSQPNLHKQDMEQFLIRLSQHQVFKKDLELQTFLESKFVYSPAPVQIHKLSINYQGYRCEDDKPYGNLRAKLMATEMILKEVMFSEQNLHKQQNQVAQALLDMAAKSINLGVSWVHLGELNQEDLLVTSIARKMGKVIQSDSEGMFQTAEVNSLNYYFELTTNSILYLMDTLMHRFNVALELEHAKLKKEKREQGLLVLKKASTINQSKVDVALEDFEMAKKYEEYRHGQMQRLNLHLPKEMEYYEGYRDSDAKRHLLNFAKLYKNHHKNILEEYQQVLENLKENRNDEVRTYTTSQPKLDSIKMAAFLAKC